MKCKFLIIVFLSSLVTVAEVSARSRPDQVLVLYNKDWTQDLDGSAPGQDSEEIARYYVTRRTDPKTGLKPYLLGLSSPDPAKPVLNEVVLPEKSSDNWLGLVFKGKGELHFDPWPLCSGGGAASVALSRLSEGSGPQRYGAAYLPMSDEEARRPAQMAISITDPGGKEYLLLDSTRPQEKNAAMNFFVVQGGIIITVDLPALGIKSGHWNVYYQQGEGSAVDLQGGVGQDEDCGKWVTTAMGKNARAPALPARAAILPGLFSEPQLLLLSESSNVLAYELAAPELQGVEEASVKLQVQPVADSAAKGVVVFADGRQQGQADVTVYRTLDGSVIYSCDAAKLVDGTVNVELTAHRKGNGEVFRKTWTLYDLDDFEASETGADGVRDDQVYLDVIETPVKRFLENNRTADGVLLRDHILYIVVAHGLPLQVSSLYGIERGVASARTRAGNMGSGSALTQRIRMLYYDIKQLNWRPVMSLAGTERPDTGLPHVAHSIKAGLTGAGYNPYLHPLTHSDRGRRQVWGAGGNDALRKLSGTPFSTHLRKQVGPVRFLYGAGRIDGPSVAIAQAQVDGALYGERYLRPEMGPVYYGTYQEGPDAATSLAEMGFKTVPVPARAERALMLMGVFGYGATSEADVAEDPSGRGGTSMVWEKGFLPGSIGFGVRSFLGWDRRRPPRPNVQLFDQLVRAGVTVTAGSAGGSHETNVSWWDSVVFNYLLLSGYEYGEATLRSMLYLDWTVSLVGDPLYSPGLFRTVADQTPPSVARREDITLKLFADGDGTYALKADVILANQDPEMAEIRIDCVPVGAADKATALSGANTFYAAAPSAFVRGLAAETEYEVNLVLTDPYGNRYESRPQLGALRVKTSAARMPVTVADKSFEKWTATQRMVVDLAGHPLDEQGELHLFFSADPEIKNCTPQVTSAAGRPLFQFSGFQVGGAQMDLKYDKQLIFDQGGDYHVMLRWKRFPVTREVYLVTPAGAEYLLNSANNLQWDSSDIIGKDLTISSRCPVKRVVVKDSAPSAPAAHRGPLRLAFDREKFLLENR